MQIGNWITEDGLLAMKRAGWIERARKPIPHEGRNLVTLWHPYKALGEGYDRHHTAVERFRSLPIDAPVQLSLFGEAC